MRETVALKADIHQSRVPVQGFKHHGLDLLTKEVVSELDLTDPLVMLEWID